MVAAKGGSQVERAIKIKMQNGRIVFEFVVMVFSVRNCSFFFFNPGPNYCYNFTHTFSIT